jgi:hypothetical protein
LGGEKEGRVRWRGPFWKGAYARDERAGVEDVEGGEHGRRRLQHAPRVAGELLSDTVIGCQGERRG